MQAHKPADFGGLVRADDHIGEPVIDQRITDPLGHAAGHHDDAVFTGDVFAVRA